MLKIGFAEGVITPPGRVSLQGQYHIRVSAEPPAEDILAVGMAVSNGRENLFWAACDLCHIPQALIDGVLAALEGVLPVTRENLILHATHIHTGPFVVDAVSSLNGNHMIPADATPAEECRRAVTEGIVHALKNAYAAREDAFLETTVARVRTGVSRRIHYRSGETVMYGGTATSEFLRSESRDGGPIQLAYARRSADGALMGVIADVPCTAQVVENKEYISPDYMGAARAEVRRTLGVPLFGVIGASGDLSPHVLLGRYPGMPDDRDEAGRLALGRRVAEAVAEHAEDHLRRAEDFRHLYRSVRLPLWQSTPEERDAALRRLDAWRARYGAELDYEKMRAEGFDDAFGLSTALAQAERCRETQEYFRADVHAFRFGRAAFITNPFELYTEYADRMRAALPGVQIFDVELAGDGEAYLPTRRAVRGGGYSAAIFSGLTGPEGGEILTQESIEMLKSLY